MSKPADFISEMQARLNLDPLWRPTLSDIVRYTDGDTGAEMPFYNEVGETIARGFLDGHLSFDFCDDVANGLFGTLHKGQSRVPQPPWPDLFWDVYLALDSGEYRHPEDEPTVNPIEKYTIPLIREILARLSAS